MKYLVLSAVLVVTLVVGPKHVLLVAGGLLVLGLGAVGYGCSVLLKQVK